MDIPEFYLIKQVINLTVPEMLTYVYLAVFLVLLAVSGFILTRKNTWEIVERYPSLCPCSSDF